MTNNEEHDVERLYRQHFAELYRYGLNLCGDEELVKDCIQDFFAHLLAGQSLLSRVDNMRSYLFASIRHGLYAALDKQYRQDSLDADAPFDLQVTDEELARVADTGVRFIVGSDAHSPDRIGDTKLVDEQLARIGFPRERIDNIDGRKPHFRFRAFKEGR